MQVSPFHKKEIIHFLKKAIIQKQVACKVVRGQRVDGELKGKIKKKKEIRASKTAKAEHHGSFSLCKELQIKEV
jgi:hypothetical protein